MRARRTLLIVAASCALAPTLVAAQQRRPAPVTEPPPLVRLPAPDAGRDGRRASLAHYITADDYPVAALRAEEEGSVGFELEIGPNGRVTSCSIIESSGSAALDSTTCRIMRVRPRFSPARNASGEPVADRVRSTIRWEIEKVMITNADELAGLIEPENHYPAAARAGRIEGDVTYRVAIGADGSPARCTILRSSGSPVLDQATCAFVQRRARFPRRDGPGGATAPTSLSATVRWRLPEPTGSASPQ